MEGVESVGASEAGMATTTVFMSNVGKFVPGTVPVTGPPQVMATNCLVDHCGS